MSSSFFTIKPIRLLGLAILLSAGIGLAGGQPVRAHASGREEAARIGQLPTLPSVTEEMYDPAYWLSGDEAQDTTVLATPEEIRKANQAILDTPRTRMYNLQTYELSKQVSADKVTWLIAVNRCDLRTKPSAKKSSDPGYDALQESALRVGEPAVADGVSADGQWYHVLVTSDSGWVKKSDVAVCHSKEEWLEAQQAVQANPLTITASSLTLGVPGRASGKANTGNSDSNILLSMGTRLPLVGTQVLGGTEGTGNSSGKEAESREEVEDLSGSQTSQTGEGTTGNGTSDSGSLMRYEVAVPGRDADGYYTRETASLVREAGDGVYEGIPALTQQNLLETAFHMLGTPYGWGSMSGNEDCSGFVRAVYLVFGYDLPRNTSEQDDIPVYGVSFAGKSRQARKALLDSLPAGAILFQNGHEMLYLGARNGHYYVINDASSIQRPGGTDKWYVRKVIVNALDETRHANGVLWLDSLVSARVPFWF